MCVCSAGCEVHSAGLWYMFIRWGMLYLAFREAPLTPASLVARGKGLCFAASLFQSFGVSQQCSDLICDLPVCSHLSSYTRRIRRRRFCLGAYAAVACLIYAICELDIGLPWPSKRLLLPLSFPSLFPSRRILRSETGAAAAGYTSPVILLFTPSKRERLACRRHLSRCRPCPHPDRSICAHPCPGITVLLLTSHPAPLPLSGAPGCPAPHLLYMHLSAKPESCASVQINYSLQSWSDPSPALIPAPHRLRLHHHRT